MKWFTLEAHKQSDDGESTWDTTLAEYQDHLDSILDCLPADLATFARDSRYHLHDAELRQVVVDSLAQTVEMDLYIIDGRRLHLNFAGAKLVPGDPATLAGIVGMTADDHAYTEVCDQEIDLTPDGLFVLRLELFSYLPALTEFAVEFKTCALSCRDMTPAELAGRWDDARPGALIFTA